MLKLMILPRTRAGMSRRAMQSHLEQVHGPLCMRHADVGGRFRRYVHHYATDAAVDPLLGGLLLGDRDALTIITFDDMDAFRASTSSAGYRDAVGPDEDNFREVEGSLFFFADEAVLREERAGAATKLFHLRRFADGVDPILASQTWCKRVRRLLSPAGDGAASSCYVHNRVVSGGARPAFHAIDEIGLDGSGGDLSAVGSALADAQAGLFDAGATAAMVTRPKVFVGWRCTSGPRTSALAAGTLTSNGAKHRGADEDTARHHGRFRGHRRKASLIVPSGTAVSRAATATMAESHAGTPLT